jgi:hypothetical protein
MNNTPSESFLNDTTEAPAGLVIIRLRVNSSIIKIPETDTFIWYGFNFDFTYS